MKPYFILPFSILAKPIRNAGILSIPILLGCLISFAVFAEPSTNAIKIGALLPLTGPAATTGEQLRKAISLAVDDYAARTGVKSEVIIEDSKNDPAEGITGFRKLATLDRVNSVIVSLSGVSQAVAPIANSEKMPTFALASAPILTKPNDYALRWFIDGMGEARTMADYLSAKGLRRVAIMHINDDYGRSLLKEFNFRAKAKGINIVSVEGFDRKTEDFRSLAFRAKKAKPDAVYFIAYGRPLGIALRQTFESGIKVPYVTTFGLDIAGTKELAGEAAEGLVYTSIAFGEGVPVSESTQSFTKRFNEIYHTTPSSDAALAYDLTTRLLSLGDSQASPREWVGQKIETQFGKLTVLKSLEVLAPVVLKAIENGHSTIVQP